MLTGDRRPLTQTARSSQPARSRRFAPSYQPPDRARCQAPAAMPDPYGPRETGDLPADRPQARSPPGADARRAPRTRSPPPVPTARPRPRAQATTDQDRPMPRPRAATQATAAANGRNPTPCRASTARPTSRTATAERPAPGDRRPTQADDGAEHATTRATAADARRRGCASRRHRWAVGRRHRDRWATAYGVPAHLAGHRPYGPGQANALRRALRPPSAVAVARRRSRPTRYRRTPLDADLHRRQSRCPGSPGRRRRPAIRSR